jgi:hypothetical protein
MKSLFMTLTVIFALVSLAVADPAKEKKVGGTRKADFKVWVENEGSGSNAKVVIYLKNTGKDILKVRGPYYYKDNGVEYSPDANEFVKGGEKKELYSWYLDTHKVTITGWNLSAD